MKILVTGCVGFSGSAVVRHIINNADVMVNVNKLAYAGNIESLADVATNSRYEDAEKISHELGWKPQETFESCTYKICIEQNYGGRA